jgi:Putative zinc-finger
MDHTGIDDQQTAERYVLGRLSEEERLRFEEHFLDCPRCLESIEAAEGLRAALKEVSSSEHPAALPETNVAQFRRPARTSRPFLTFLAAACVPLGILSLFFYAQTRGVRRELDDSRRLLEQSQRSQTELQDELRRESAERGRASEQNRSFRTAPVFLLNLTRGTEPAEPQNHVVLPDAPGWVTLVFDRPDARDATGYRVRVATSDGRSIGDAAASTTSGGLLSVSIPSEQLASGDYVLTVERPDGTRTLATYRFRAAAKR